MGSHRAPEVPETQPFRVVVRVPPVRPKDPPDHIELDPETYGRHSHA